MIFLWRSFRLAFVMLGEGSKQLAQAVQTQLHDAPVSRRPVTMHCFSIAGDVISMAEEVGHNSSGCSRDPII